MEHRFAGGDERRQGGALVIAHAFLVERPVEQRLERDDLLHVVLQPRREAARVQLRVEIFNLFNQVNLGQPGRTATVGSTSFGVISNTRFPTGDSGSARQIQFAAKFLF